MKKFTLLVITLTLLVAIISCETSSWYENQYTSNFIVKNRNGEPIPNTTIYLMRDRDGFNGGLFNKVSDSVVTDKEGKASMNYAIYVSDSNQEFGTFFVKNENFLPVQIAERMSGSNSFLKDPFELIVDTAATYKVRILRKNSTAVANLEFEPKGQLISNFSGRTSYFKLIKTFNLSNISNLDTTLTFKSYKNKSVNLYCYLYNSASGRFCSSEDVPEKDFKNRDIQLTLTK